MTTSAGLLLVASRELRRCAVDASVSFCTLSSQPWLLAGLSSHPCTSSAAARDRLVENAPNVGIDPVNDGVATKSPPGVVHSCVFQKRCSHVASPTAAAPPPPPPPDATLVPSPHEVVRRWPLIASGSATVVCVT